MPTTTMHDRLKELDRRIDDLQERAKTAHGEAKSTTRERVEKLRKQAETTRAAVDKALDERERVLSQKIDDADQANLMEIEAAEDRLDELETNFKVAAHAHAADTAEDAKLFAEAVSEELHEWGAYFDRVEERLATQTESAVADLRQRHDAIGEHVDALRASSEDSWVELRKRIDDEREKLAIAATSLQERLHR